MKHVTGWDTKTKKFKTYTITGGGQILGEGMAPSNVQQKAAQVRRAKLAEQQKKAMERLAKFRK